MLDLELIAQPAQAEDRPPVEGFAGWWDASHAGSVQSGLGNTAREWRDRSGAGRHFAQASDAKRPFTGGLSQNGRNVLVATVAATELNGNTPLTANPYTIFLVAANAAADAVQRSLWSGLYLSGGEWGRVYRPTSNLIALYLSGGPVSSQSWERSRPRVVTGLFNGGSSAVRVDGRYSNTGSVSGVGTSTGQTVLGFGASESWVGWIGELILYSARALTTAEMQRVESYLTRKWGIA